MLKKLLTYGLILSLLAATLYVPVFVHTCYLFDVTKTSIFTQVKCCDSSQSDHHERLTFGCCSLEVKTLKAEITSQLTNYPLELPALTWQANAYSNAPSLALLSGSTGEFASRPQPEKAYNRSLLTIIQVFRI